MKKFITLSLAAALFLNLAFAGDDDNDGKKWSTKGNSIDNGDFLGTKNNFTLGF